MKLYFQFKIQMEFRLATRNDISIVKKFLIEEIYPDEPLSKAAGLSKEPYELEFHLSLVPNGLSFLGFISDELIGIGLFGEKTRNHDEQEYERELERVKGSRWAKVIELEHNLQKKANIFDRFGVDRYLHCYIGGIKRSHRAQGLVLLNFDRVQEQVDYMRSKGYTLVTGDATNFRSARLADWFGAILCYEYPYSEFRDESGKPYMDSRSRQKFVKTYAYSIKDWDVLISDWKRSQL